MPLCIYTHKHTNIACSRTLKTMQVMQSCKTIQLRTYPEQASTGSRNQRMPQLVPQALWRQLRELPLLLFGLEQSELIQVNRRGQKTTAVNDDCVRFPCRDDDASDSVLHSHRKHRRGSTCLATCGADRLHENGHALIMVEPISSPLSGPPIELFRSAFPLPLSKGFPRRLCCVPCPHIWILSRKLPIILFKPAKAGPGKRKPEEKHRMANATANRSISDRRG
jgi:hypothetical protein